MEQSVPGCSNDYFLSTSCIDTNIFVLPLWFAVTCFVFCFFAYFHSRCPDLLSVYFSGVNVRLPYSLGSMSGTGDTPGHQIMDGGVFLSKNVFN